MKESMSSTSPSVVTIVLTLLFAGSFAALDTIISMLPNIFLLDDEAAVIVALPIPTPVTLPFLSTVATVSSEDVHVTDLTVADVGRIVAVKVVFSPTLRASTSPLTATLSTSIASCTVIMTR